MTLHVLGTGSSGNCYVLQSSGAALLLDAGFPFRKISKGLGYDLSKVQACLITHEHGDHAIAAPELTLRGIPCWMSAGTATALEKGTEALYKRFTQLPAQIQVGPFAIRAFATEHDAAEPVGYLIMDVQTGERLLYATDTYFLRYTFPGVHYWVVECNYIEELAEAMMDAGQMDPAVYARLQRSHMSLERLLQAFTANDMRDTRQIVLVHLSDERSDERQMVRAIEDATGISCEAATINRIFQLRQFPF